MKIDTSATLWALRAVALRRKSLLFAGSKSSVERAAAKHSLSAPIAEYEVGLAKRLFERCGDHLRRGNIARLACRCWKRVSRSGCVDRRRGISEISSYQNVPVGQNRHGRPVEEESLT
jgi:hypothetical protein